MTLPPIHAPFAGGDVDDLHAELRRIVEHGITHQPRSLQTRIGPSEVGDPCDHCLAAKLAGWAKTPDGVGWLPFVGTCVHEWLERHFIQHENDRTGGNHTASRRFLVEQRVTVGQAGGQTITGSCDLFDTVTGTTVDWKITGANTLRTARRGPTPKYRVQAHLYGRGWANAGYTVRNVSIIYLPRNSMGGWDDAVTWHEPYDEQVAINALNRVDRIANNLRALEALGPDAVTAWIGQLPRDPDCWDCPRYPDGAGMTKPGHKPPVDQLDGLIPNHTAA